LGEKYLGIAAWMDEAATPDLEGCKAGEAIVLRAYRDGEDEEIDVEGTFERGSGKFGDGPLAVVVCAEKTRMLSGDSPILCQSVPNPLRSEARIAYYLPRNGYVRLSVYDASGRLVRKLLEGTEEAGEGIEIWDGFDEQGRRLPAGVYMYRLEVEDRVLSKKLLLAR
jgi:hypothetical protein